MWSERGELAVASERYAALLRKAPACWQLLQDRGNFFLFQDELRRAEADFTSALDLQSSRFVDALHHSVFRSSQPIAQRCTLGLLRCLVEVCR